MHFQNFPGGACPQTSLGIACQRHARLGVWPKYPPIIARFPPVKNLSYIPEHDTNCKENSEKNPRPRWDLNPRPSVI